MIIIRSLFLLIFLLNTSFCVFAQDEASPEITPASDKASEASESENSETSNAEETTENIPSNEKMETSTTTTDAESEAPQEEAASSIKKVTEDIKPDISPSEKKAGIVSDEEIAPLKKNKSTNEKLSSETYVQQSERFKLPENYKTIDLSTVIEQGLRESHDEKINELKRELFSIKRQSALTSFWLPHVQLQLSTEEQHLGTLRKGNKNGPAASKSPTGTFGLYLGDYTVFNWGKDYLQYLNKTKAISRSTDILAEEKRNLRHKLIESFFELVTAKNIEKIMRNELRQASFIFRLNKEKISVGKASKQEYYESRSQYLKAQKDFQEATLKSELAEGNIQNLISDSRGSSYIVNQNILFSKISIPLDELLGIGKVKSPTILDAKTKLEITSNSYLLAAKESLPLPRLSVNLGAYTNRFNKNYSSTTYETRSNNSDIELVATVNATWDILGERGLLNSKERETAYLEKEISLRSFTQARDNTDYFIRELYKKILFYEKQFILQEANTSNLQKNFDTILDSYVSKRANLSDLRRALDDLTSNLESFEQIKMEHLRSKLFLAKIIGMEDLPGESFDKLITGVKQ